MKICSPGTYCACTIVYRWMDQLSFIKFCRKMSENIKQWAVFYEILQKHVCLVPWLYVSFPMDLGLGCQYDGKCDNFWLSKSDVYLKADVHIFWCLRLICPVCSCQISQMGSTTPFIGSLSKKWGFAAKSVSKVPQEKWTFVSTQFLLSEIRFIFVFFIWSTEFFSCSEFF